MDEVVLTPRRARRRFIARSEAIDVASLDPSDKTSMSSHHNQTTRTSSGAFSPSMRRANTYELPPPPVTSSNTSAYQNGNTTPSRYGEQNQSGGHSSRRQGIGIARSHTLDTPAPALVSSSPSRFGDFDPKRIASNFRAAKMLSQSPMDHSTQSGEKRPSVSSEDSYRAGARENYRNQSTSLSSSTDINQNPRTGSYRDSLDSQRSSFDGNKSGSLSRGFDSVFGSERQSSSERSSITGSSDTIGNRSNFFAPAAPYERPSNYRSSDKALTSFPVKSRNQSEDSTAGKSTSRENKLTQRAESFDNNNQSTTASTSAGLQPHQSPRAQTKMKHDDGSKVKQYSARRAKPFLGRAKTVDLATFETTPDSRISPSTSLDKTSKEESDKQKFNYMAVPEPPWRSHSATRQKKENPHDLGIEYKRNSFSGPVPDEFQHPKTDNLDNSSSRLSRCERIAHYKDQRRKELAEKYGPITGLQKSASSDIQMSHSKTNENLPANVKGRSQSQDFFPKPLSKEEKPTAMFPSRSSFDSLPLSRPGSMASQITSLGSMAPSTTSVTSSTSGYRGSTSSTGAPQSGPLELSRSEVISPMGVTYRRTSGSRSSLETPPRSPHCLSPSPSHGSGYGGSGHFETPPRSPRGVKAFDMPQRTTPNTGVVEYPFKRNSHQDNQQAPQVPTPPRSPGTYDNVSPTSSHSRSPSRRMETSTEYPGSTQKMYPPQSPSSPTQKPFKPIEFGTSYAKPSGNKTSPVSAATTSSPSSFMMAPASPLTSSAVSQILSMTTAVSPLKPHVQSNLNKTQSDVRGDKFSTSTSDSKTKSTNTTVAPPVGTSPDSKRAPIMSTAVSNQSFTKVTPQQKQIPVDSSSVQLAHMAPTSKPADQSSKTSELSTNQTSATSLKLSQPATGQVPTTVPSRMCGVTHVPSNVTQISSNVVKQNLTQENVNNRMPIDRTKHSSITTFPVETAPVKTMPFRQSSAPNLIASHNIQSLKNSPSVVSAMESPPTKPSYVTSSVTAVPHQTTTVTSSLVTPVSSFQAVTSGGQKMWMQSAPLLGKTMDFQNVGQPATATKSASAQNIPSMKDSQLESQKLTKSASTSQMTEERRKILQRADSFNRPDSPIRDPMPLPKDSVIIRNRLKRCDSSSSSDSQPETSGGRSPRLSPRVVRRQKVKSVEASSASKHLYPPHDTTFFYRSNKEQQHQQQKQRDEDRFSSKTIKGKELKDQKADVEGRKSSSLTRGAVPDYFNFEQKGDTESSQRSLLEIKKTESLDIWVTPPSSPKMGNQKSKNSNSPTTTTAPPKDVQTNVPPSPVLGSRNEHSWAPLDANKVVSPSPNSPQLSRPSSAAGAVASDSSNASTRRDRRRFRRREGDTVPENTEVKVRPGKKDKSSARKSTLNSIDDAEVNRRRGLDSTDSQESFDGRPKSMFVAGRPQETSETLIKPVEQKSISHQDVSGKTGPLSPTRIGSTAVSPPPVSTSTPVTFAEARRQFFSQQVAPSSKDSNNGSPMMSSTMSQHPKSPPPVSSPVLSPTQKSTFTMATGNANVAVTKPTTVGTIQKTQGPVTTKPTSTVSSASGTVVTKSGTTGAPSTQTATVPSSLVSNSQGANISSTVNVNTQRTPVPQAIQHGSAAVSGTPVSVSSPASKVTTISQHQTQQTAKTIQPVVKTTTSSMPPSVSSVLVTKPTSAIVPQQTQQQPVQPQQQVQQQPVKKQQQSVQIQQQPMVQQQQQQQRPVQQQTGLKTNATSVSQQPISKTSPTTTQVVTTSTIAQKTQVPTTTVASQPVVQQVPKTTITTQVGKAQEAAKISAVPSVTPVTKPQQVAPTAGPTVVRPQVTQIGPTTTASTTIVRPQTTQAITAIQGTPMVRPQITQAGAAVSATTVRQQTPKVVGIQQTVRTTAVPPGHPTAATVTAQGPRPATQVIGTQQVVVRPTTVSQTQPATIATTTQKSMTVTQPVTSLTGPQPLSAISNTSVVSTIGARVAPVIQSQGSATTATATVYTTSGSIVTPGVVHQNSSSPTVKTTTVTSVGTPVKTGATAPQVVSQTMPVKTIQTVHTSVGQPKPPQTVTASPAPKVNTTVTQHMEVKTVVPAQMSGSQAQVQTVKTTSNTSLPPGQVFPSITKVTPVSLASGTPVVTTTTPQKTVVASQPSVSTGVSTTAVKKDVMTTPSAGQNVTRSNVAAPTQTQFVTKSTVASPVAGQIVTRTTTPSTVQGQIPQVSTTSTSVGQTLRSDKKTTLPATITRVVETPKTTTTVAVPHKTTPTVTTSRVVKQGPSPVTVTREEEQKSKVTGHQSTSVSNIVSVTQSTQHPQPSTGIMSANKVNVPTQKVGTQGQQVEPNVVQKIVEESIIVPMDNKTAQNAMPVKAEIPSGQNIVVVNQNVPQGQTGSIILSNQTVLQNQASPPHSQTKQQETKITGATLSQDTKIPPQITSQQSTKVNESRVIIGPNSETLPKAVVESSYPQAVKQQPKQSSHGMDIVDALPIIPQECKVVENPPSFAMRDLPERSVTENLPSPQDGPPKKIGKELAGAIKELKHVTGVETSGSENEAGHQKTMLTVEESTSSPTKGVVMRNKDTPRRRDISDLVKRFSGTESEPSDREISPSPRRVSFTRGIPETLEEIPSRNQTSGSRQTPERSQSLKETESPEKESSPKVVRRVKSTRDRTNGDGVRRRFNKSDQPDDELAKILNRRSKNLEDWELQLAQNKDGLEEKAIEEYEQKIEQDKIQQTKEEEAIMDSELQSVLMARRFKEESDPNMIIAESSPASDRSRSNSRSNSDAGFKPVSILKNKHLENAKNGVLKDTTNLRNSSPNRQAVLQRTGSLENPTGPSPAKSEVRPVLRRAKTVDVPKEADPQLMSMLKARRTQDSDEEDKPKEQEVVRRRKKSITPEREGGREEEEEEKRLSVVERIFQMEEKSQEATGSATPSSRRSASGLSTPRRTKIRSLQNSGPGTPGTPGILSPRQQNGKPANTSLVLSDEALLSKLSEMSICQDVASSRRQRYLARCREEWRVRTQPVTDSEIFKGECLDSVASFRAEIMKKASLNVFKEQEKEATKPAPVGKKTKGTEQFPSPFKREKLKERRQNPRFKTLPITLQELNEIPESEPITITGPTKLEIKHPALSRGRKPQRKKLPVDKSAIKEEDSDSDFEKLVEVNFAEISQTQNKEMKTFLRSMDVPEGDPANLDQKQKVAMFKTNISITEDIEKNEGAVSPPVDTKPPPRGASRRLLDRKKRLERAKTQPVTEDEVNTVEESRDSDSRDGPIGRQPDIVNKSQQDDEGSSHSEDELSKLSLSEKMKLFSQAKSAEDAKPAKRETPVTRRSRRVQSRFKTQPITSEEVEKAKISPLAMSLVKPPDSEILAGLSLKDQREMMANWAQNTLSQLGSKQSSRSSSNQGSQPGSRRESTGEDGDGDDKGTKGILKVKEPQEVEVRSILKPERQSTPEREVRGILKSETTTSPPASHSSDTSPTRSSGKGILKRDSLTDKLPETRGILKKDSSFESVQKSEPDKSVLKRDSVTDTKLETPERSVLRKDGNFEVKAESQSKSSLKTESLKNEDNVEVKGILKEPHFEIKDDQEQLQSILKTGDIVPGTPKQTESSTEEEVLSDTKYPKIKNEAVARRRMQNKMRKAGEKERMAALQKSGEEDWQKRIGKINRITSAPIKMGDQETLLGDTPKAAPEAVVKLREKRPGGKAERPHSIADRLAALEGAQKTWEGRVGEKDMEQFTVAGKLGKSPAADSPMAERRRAIKSALVRAHSTPNISSIVLPKGESVSSSDEPKTPVKIAVPKPDDESFTSFYDVKSTEEICKNKVDVTVDDFDHIFMEGFEILPSFKKARPQKRKNASSKNPLRKLRERKDLQEEYEEVLTGVEDRELRRLKKEQIAGKANFTESALAGITSFEEFGSIKLTKTDPLSAVAGQYHPYKDLMLIQVKGRRCCQLRLVEPSASSINSGDCFLLVVDHKVFVWVGEYCNVIEKAKAMEVANIILQKKDLGCKKFDVEPIIVTEAKQNSGPGLRFWKHLGGPQEYEESGPAEEDEQYEVFMAETNKVYKIDLETFSVVPYEELWGCVPSHALLDSKECIIFDYGSEFYVWTGKHVPFEKRKRVVSIAKSLWDQGYDYSSFDINPLSPFRGQEDEGGLPVKDTTRPEWALFGKISENMETILFKEKFINWPDESRLIKVKGQNEDRNSKGEVELVAYDAKKMVHAEQKPVSLELEGTHVGRGNKWVEFKDGLRREWEILTLNTTVWHVLEGTRLQLEPMSMGQFHEGDTYVVRWHYMRVQTGVKTLKGERSSRQSLTGRERCAYFFWQGKHSSITEKGASALMTVELDEERGPQVRVLQGKEPPCFLNLFASKMIIHIGKREEEDTNTQGAFRFYIVRNEHQNEAHLLEIPCKTANLRSSSSFILLNVKTGALYIWHGAISAEHTRQRAVELAKSIAQNKPLETGLHPKATIVIKEMKEGEEKSEFWAAMDQKDRNRYNSMLKEPKTFTQSARLFYMNSVSGVFEATEILNPARNSELWSPFPFLQTDLYNADIQPALFLLDIGDEVYLWQGWWPESTEEVENVKTGSATARFALDKICALETTLQYCKEKDGENPPPAHLIHAGLEPLEFTNLFPLWEDDEQISQINLKEGKEPGKIVSVEELLTKLTKTKYTWEELAEQPLPEGVDPMKLETYLNDQDFEDKLEMTRDQFKALPTWKQINLKKQVGLY